VLWVSSVDMNGIRAAAPKGLARIPAGLPAGRHLSHAACEDVRGRNGERWPDHAPVTVAYEPA
jgi:hypothetical protein